MVTHLTCLLVTVSDRISDLILKGEIVARYYNPGELFDEVHILMTNDDKPDKESLQKTVGRAKLYLHNLPSPLFLRTFGWQPLMIKKWVASGIQMAREIRPSLVRAYGNQHINGFLAAQIKQQLNVPMIVSLHANPDVDMRGITCSNPNKQILMDIKLYLYYQRMIFFENETLKMADFVLPVYDAPKGYAIKHGARRVKVCYNVVNPEALKIKDSYSLHNPPRIILVGRQHPCKNPENLICAFSRIPDIQLTIVGDGELHNYLVNLVKNYNISDRVEFIRAIPNDQFCQSLPEYDIFAVQNEYWGISKTVIEALLTGLPIVHNIRKGEQVHEFNKEFMCLVENTVDGYYNALRKMLTDHSYREQLGRNGYSHAHALWSPEKTEAAYVEIYRQVLSEYKQRNEPQKL